MPFTIVQCYAMRLLAKVVAVFIPMSFWLHIQRIRRLK